MSLESLLSLKSSRLSSKTSCASRKRASARWLRASLLIPARLDLAAVLRRPVLPGGQGAAEDLPFNSFDFAGLEALVDGASGLLRFGGTLSTGEGRSEERRVGKEWRSRW